MMEQVFVAILGLAECGKVVVIRVGEMHWAGRKPMVDVWRHQWVQGGVERSGSFLAIADSACRYSLAVVMEVIQGQKLREGRSPNDCRPHAPSFSGPPRYCDYRSKAAVDLHGIRRALGLIVFLQLLPEQDQSSRSANHWEQLAHKTAACLLVGHGEVLLSRQASVAAVVESRNSNEEAQPHRESQAGRAPRSCLSRAAFLLQVLLGLLQCLL